MSKFVFVKDYPLAGKKIGDSFGGKVVPRHLTTYIKAVDEKTNDGGDETPTEKWKNADIIEWLAERGVVADGTKEELLKEVKAVLKK